MRFELHKFLLEITKISEFKKHYNYTYKPTWTLAFVFKFKLLVNSI